MGILGGNINHFGLDIGANNIRVVQLSGGNGHYSLSAFGSADVPEGLTQSDSKIDQQALAKIITELLKKTQIDTKNVVSAIPGTSVFNTVIKVPNMSQSELAKAIKFQAEQNLPIKLEDAKFDWQVIRQDPTTKEIVVMIVAATKGKVNSMLDLFKYAELNPIALETAAFGMGRSLGNPQDPLAMILDIGSNTTEVAIVQNGVLSLTRSLSVAGNAMTRAISQGLRLDKDQAETFKMKFGLSQDKLEGQVYKAIEPVLKNILDESIRINKFYQEQFGQQVQRVILTGGSSRLPLLAEYIKSTMEVEVLYGNPWSKISFQPSFSDKLNQIAPEFATVVGLAMRE